LEVERAKITKPVRRRKRDNRDHPTAAETSNAGGKNGPPKV